MSTYDDIRGDIEHECKHCPKFWANNVLGSLELDEGILAKHMNDWLCGSISKEDEQTLREEFIRIQNFELEELTQDRLRDFEDGLPIALGGSA